MTTAQSSRRCQGASCCVRCAALSPLLQGLSGPHAPKPDSSPLPLEAYKGGLLQGLMMALTPTGPFGSRPRALSCAGTSLQGYCHSSMNASQASAICLQMS